MGSKDFIKQLQGFPLAWQWQRKNNVFSCDQALIDALGFSGQKLISLKQFAARLDSGQVQYLQKAILDSQKQQDPESEHTLELNLIFNIDQARYAGQVLLWKERINQVNGSLEFLLPLLNKHSETELIGEHLTNPYSPALICNNHHQIIWLNQSACEELSQPSYQLLACKLNNQNGTPPEQDSATNSLQCKSLNGLSINFDAQAKDIHTNAPKQRFFLYQLEVKHDSATQHTANLRWDNEQKFAQQLAEAQQFLEKQETLVVFALKLRAEGDNSSEKMKRMILDNLRRLNQKISVGFINAHTLSGFLATPKKLAHIQHRLSSAVTQLLKPSSPAESIQSQMGVSVLGVDASNSKQLINHAKHAMANSPFCEASELATESRFFDTRLEKAKQQGSPKKASETQAPQSKQHDDMYIDLDS
ncbi:hypothetical protein AHAT_28050 [Agarivorans sp. Toyoura001]|uniref:hypothetical protein n=1 Tax=Agarivorans sp. Toyoura001 TaxID=2283141 RepID=UPI0010E9F363|nr:hypothetical protein [Agarivorans sp. Toyoura001]GDY26915.1 hypothetical protein AHAT_28050 [Agarivorans sp. Toyoura001]